MSSYDGQTLGVISVTGHVAKSATHPMPLMPVESDQAVSAFLIVLVP